jgi:hypothetical protein
MSPTSNSRSDYQPKGYRKVILSYIDAVFALSDDKQYDLVSALLKEFENGLSGVGSSPALLML